MSKVPITPGRAVLSKAGRDAGRHFVVLRVEEPYAFIADGDLRRVKTPKKKKQRHLRAVQGFFPSIADILKDGKLPSDAEIRRCLAQNEKT